MGAFGARHQQRRLAEELRRLRLSGGLTGYDLGDRTGIQQSAVSRIENGHQKPSIRQVDAWCRAVGAPEPRRLRLLEIAEEVLSGPESWGDASEARSTHFHRETAEMEALAGTISIYQPAILPGLTQTPAYARRVFEADPEGLPQNVGELVMSRRERQRILYDESKRLRFVIPETVLRWPFGPTDDPAVLDEQLEQLARLDTIMARPNVELGLLPMRPTAVWRFGGFVIFDDMKDEEPIVHLETLTRPVNIDRPGQIEQYRQVFAQLKAAAVHGDQARALLNQIIEDLRVFP